MSDAFSEHLDRCRRRARLSRELAASASRRAGRRIEVPQLTPEQAAAAAEEIAALLTEFVTVWLSLTEDVPMPQSISNVAMRAKSALSSATAVVTEGGDATER